MRMLLKSHISSGTKTVSMIIFVGNFITGQVSYLISFIHIFPRVSNEIIPYCEIKTDKHTLNSVFHFNCSQADNLLAPSGNYCLTLNTVLMIVLIFRLDIRFQRIVINVYGGKTCLRLVDPQMYGVHHLWLVGSRWHTTGWRLSQVLDRKIIRCCISDKVMLTFH